MKTSLLLLLILWSGQAISKPEDSAKIQIPTISYRSLDSLIRTNELTAIYFWPSWCSACRSTLPVVQDVLRRKKSIEFISVNDPDSRPFLSKKLIRHPQAGTSYYRIQRHGREPVISINDHRQFQYFNRHFTGETGRTWPQLIEQFLLLDRSGKILYYSKSEFQADSLVEVLRQYQ